MKFCLHFLVKNDFALSATEDFEFSKIFVITDLLFCTSCFTHLILVMMVYKEQCNGPGACMQHCRGSILTLKS